MDFNNFGRAGIFVAHEDVIPASVPQFKGDERYTFRINHIS